MAPIYRRAGLVLGRHTDSGDPRVKALQQDLRRLGYLRSGIDGNFGEGTERAVRALQWDLLHAVSRGSDGEALGIVETRTVAATLQAADAGVKGAAVELLEVRLADGLGGKAFALFGGPVTDVEAAIEHAVGALASPDLVIAHAVIAQLHPEMRLNLRAHAEFGERVRAARV